MRDFMKILPALMAGNILQALSGTLIFLYAGNILGLNELAAMAALTPIVMLSYTIATGIGIGTSIIVGKACGGQQRELIPVIFATAIKVSLSVSAAISAGGFWYSEQILNHLGTPPSLVGTAAIYAKWTFVSLPISFTTMTMLAVVRGAGETIVYFRALAAFFFATLIVTPLLMQTWDSRTSIASAPASLCIANCICTVWIAYTMRTCKPFIPPISHWQKLFSIDKKITFEIFRLGMPTSVFFISWSSADAALLAAVNSKGVHAVAAWGIANQIVNYVHFPAMTIAASVSVLSAKAVGAKRMVELGKIARTGIALNLAITGVIALGVAICAHQVAGLFSADSAIADNAAEILHITVWSGLFFGLSSVLTGVMRVCGVVFLPLATWILGFAALLYPASKILVDYGVRGVSIAMTATFLCVLFLQAAQFRRLTHIRSSLE